MKHLFSKFFLHIVRDFVVVFLLTTNISAQLQKEISKIDSSISSSNCTVGVAVINLKNGDTLSLNGEQKFPMQSVFKFPVALKVLHNVDLGLLNLDSTLLIRRSELLPNTWSPLREKYPKGDVKVKLSEILFYTVALSDNNGCDILFRLCGGTARVNDYINSLGIDEIAIAATEDEMHKDEWAQFKNWSTPRGLAKLLRKFNAGEVLSIESTKYLKEIMTNTQTGAKRLKGKLPPGTQVAHKTGSSGMNKNGVTAATNDVGILRLHNGDEVVVVVFITNSRETEAKQEELIADIAKVIYDASIK